MSQQRKLTRKEKVEKAKQTAPPPQKNKKGGGLNLKLILGLTTAIVGFILYIQTVSYEYVLDDYSAIKSNYVVQQGISGIGTILHTSYRFGYRAGGDELYRPLSLVMFAIEWNFFPDNPAVAHFMNIFLYALTGFALFMLLSRLFKDNLLIPFIASLLFMAHPVHTEVVANIKSRDEILSFLFGIVTISWLLDYMQSRKTKKLIFSAIAFLLALLAKESAITLLAVIPLTLYVFRNVKPGKAVTAIVPLFLATVVYVILRGVALNGLIQTKVMTALDNVLVTAPDLGSRLATAILVLGKYLLLLIFPVHLSMDYAMSEITIVTFSNYRVLISLVIHLALVAYAIYTIKKKDKIAFSILYYLLTISIVSNIVLVIGTAMADRLLYAPSLGICLVVAVLLAKAFNALQANTGVSDLSNFVKAYSKPLSAVVVLVLLCSFKTIDRNPVWKNNYALYTSGAKDSPKSSRAHYLVGIELITQADKETKDSLKRLDMYRQSLTEFKKAIEYCPTNFEAYSETGIALDKLGNSTDALSYIDTALMMNPNEPHTLNNKGTIYFGRREYGKAIETFSLAVRYNPRFADALKNLGSSYGMAGDYPNALEYLIKSLAYENKKENLPNTYRMIAITYQYMGNKAKADEYFAKAK